MPRLFVAIPIPEEVKAQIRDIAYSIQIPGLKLTNHENYHLTLAFLGEADPEEVRQSLDKIAPSKTPIPITLEGFGTFPRVLWAGVKSPKLPTVAQKIKLACRPHAPKMDAGPYKPHLTLGRSQAFIAVPTQTYPPLSWVADHYELIESRLTRAGATYEIHATFQI